MFRAFANPLRIEAGPSRRLGSYLLAAHGAGLAVLPWLPLGGYLQSGLALLILAGLADSWRVHARRTAPHAIRAAELDGEGRWTLFLADGRALAASLLTSSTVHPGLSVLNFRTGRWVRRHLVLAGDAADGDALRRLRVSLKMGSGSHRSASLPGVE